MRGLERAEEIGSYFDISEKNLKDIDVEKSMNLFGEALYLSTCRSAIDIVLKNVKTTNKVALLPGFTCHAVVEPFEKNGYRVIPYFITSNLEINYSDIIKKIEEHSPSVILIHDYFGFDTNRQLRESSFIRKVQQKGIVVINDKTQSMFSSYETVEADYFLGSIRKWMGIPDGAFLLGLSDKPIYEIDTELEEAKKYAMVYKNKFLFENTGTKDNVLANYRKAETILDSREIPYAISYTSKALLNIYNIDDLKKIRQNNGQILVDAISRNENLFSPFLNISVEEVPFYIPIFIKNKRKEFQTYLARNNVFATVIWGCPDEFVNYIDKETKMIYDEILCIPCDQRYSMEDMKYICDLINSFEWEA